MLSRRTLVALSMALTLSACIDSNSSDSDTTDAVPPTDDGSGRAAYVIQNGVQTPETGRTVYLNVISDMNQAVNIENAVELGGSSRVRSAFGKVYAFNSETLEITRFSVADNLDVVADPPVLSMAALGVGFYTWSHLFASESRALYSDDSSRQFVIWNPTDMELVTSIAWPDTLPPGSAAGQPTLSADGRRAFVPFYVVDYGTLSTDPGARLAIVSLESESVEAVLYDDRCPGGQFGNLDPTTGDYIFEGDAGYAFTHHFTNPMDTASCLLRVPAGESEFDPDWIVSGSELNAAGFEDVAGTRFIGNRYLSLVRDDDVAPVADIAPDDIFAFFGDGAFWRPYIGQIGQWGAEPVTGDDAQSFLGVVYEVDGDFLLSPVDFVDRGADRVAPIYRVTDTNTLELLTESFGFVQRVERLR